MNQGPIDRYPGAKNGPGVYQWQINQIPPHHIWVDLFLGSGSVWAKTHHGKGASLGIDADAHVAQAWAGHPDIRVINTCALAWLEEHVSGLSPGTFIYADPPYVLDARRSSAPIYRHELTDADHVRLAGLLRSAPCPVMLCGYPHPLYDALYPDWRTSDLAVTTRQGPAIERVWCNYPLPRYLHDYRYLGDNKRERENHRRRLRRAIADLDARPRDERFFLLRGLLARYGEELSTAQSYRDNLVGPPDVRP